MNSEIFRELKLTWKCELLQSLPLKETSSRSLVDVNYVSVCIRKCVKAYVCGFLIQLGTFLGLSRLLLFLKTYTPMAKFGKANFPIIEHNPQKTFR